MKAFAQLKRLNNRAEVREIHERLYAPEFADRERLFHLIIFAGLSLLVAGGLGGIKFGIVNQSPSLSSLSIFLLSLSLTAFWFSRFEAKWSIHRHPGLGLVSKSQGILRWSYSRGYETVYGCKRKCYKCWYAELSSRKFRSVATLVTFGFALGVYGLWFPDWNPFAFTHYYKTLAADGSLCLMESDVPGLVLYVSASAVLLVLAPLLVVAYLETDFLGASFRRRLKCGEGGLAGEDAVPSEDGVLWATQSEMVSELENEAPFVPMGANFEAVAKVFLPMVKSLTADRTAWRHQLNFHYCFTDQFSCFLGFIWGFSYIGGRLESRETIYWLAERCLMILLIYGAYVLYRISMLNLIVLSYE